MRESKMFYQLCLSIIRDVYKKINYNKLNINNVLFKMDIEFYIYYKIYISIEFTDKIVDILYYNIV